MMEDMGWVDIEIKQSLCIIRYWNRLLEMDHTRLTNRIFLWDYNLVTGSWSNEVLKIFTNIDSQNIYRDRITCNLDAVEMKLLEIYETQWRIVIENMPKLRTYVTFKDHYCPEIYLTKCMSRRRRSLMSQLRAGILPIEIEKGDTPLF